MKKSPGFTLTTLALSLVLPGILSPLTRTAWSVTPHPMVVVAKVERPFKINFDYSGVDDALFNDEVKRQIESGARLIETFIADEGEITIKVAVGKAAGALATGAPRAYSVNTDDKSLATEGGIEFGTRFIEQARDGQSDISALTMHEILHCLGFVDRSKAIAKNLQGKKPNASYSGPNVLHFNNGQPVPFDGAHFKRGFKDKNNIAPRMSDGGGNTISIFDLAVLADLGYDVPQIKDHETPDLHFPKEYYSEGNYRGKKMREVDGEAGNDILRAFDYDREGQKGGYHLIGGGGSDVLISGPGDDILDGENATGMPYGGAFGKPGKNTYVIPADSGKDTIMGYAPGRDTIFLSPATGITTEKLEEAIKKSKEQVIDATRGMYIPGNWVLKVDDFELIVSTGSSKVKISLDDFKIEDWKPE